MSRAIRIGGSFILGLAAFSLGVYLIGEWRRADVLRAVALADPEAHDGSRSYGTPTLLVLFSPNDCPICLYETVVLNELAQELGDALRVIGVVYDLPAEDVSAFREGSGITFPLHTAPGEIEDLLRISRPEHAVGPLKLLIDERGVVLSAAQSAYTVAEHLEYAAELRSFVLSRRP